MKKLFYTFLLITLANLLSAQSRYNLTGTMVDPEDEANIKFALKEITYLPKDEDLTPFTLDVESLDETYLVTDLRF